MRKLARHILLYEAKENNAADVNAQSAALVFEKWRLYLSKIIGVAGFHSLLNRAWALAKTESDFIGALQISIDGTLVGIEKIDSEHRDPFPLDVEILLAQLLMLLDEFIGHVLTKRLVSDIWPALSLEGYDLMTKKESP